MEWKGDGDDTAWDGAGDDAGWKDGGDDAHRNRPGAAVRIAAARPDPTLPRTALKDAP